MKNAKHSPVGGRKFGAAKFGASKSGGAFGKPGGGFGKPGGGFGKPGGFNKPGGGFGKPFGKPHGGAGDRPFPKPGRPFGNAEGGADHAAPRERSETPENERAYNDPPQGGRREGGAGFKKSGGGRPFGNSGGGRPFGNAGGGGRPFGNSGGGGRPFGNSGGGGRPFGNAGGGNRPFGNSGGGRPFGPPGAGRPFEKSGDAQPFDGPSERRFVPKPGGARSFDRPRGGGTFDQPGGGRPFGKPSGGRPFGNHGGPGRRGARMDDGYDEPLARGDDDDGDEQQGRGNRARTPMLDFDDLIYGIHAVEEALRAGEKLRVLHIGRGRNEDPAVARLVEVARELGVTIRVEEPAFFARIPYKAHQSVIAIGAPFDYISLDEAINVRPAGHRLIVILDHLTDPHNVGAILRSAECAGAQAVILPDRRSAGINATVRKTSAGATSHLPIAKVGNLSQVIRELKERGFTVFGADMADDAVLYTEAKLTEDIVLVIGGEGDGLARLVARSCDQLVKIPLSGSVESLNASVAAGILLYEVVRQRSQAV